MLNNHITEPLLLRFRHPLLIEVVDDRRDLAGDTCEVVDVYECPHRGGIYTIIHVPAGTVPPGVTAAEPVEYGDLDQMEWSLPDGYTVWWRDGDFWPNQRGQYGLRGPDGEHELEQIEGFRYIAEALHECGCPSSAVNEDGEESGHWSGTMEAMEAHLGRRLVAPEIALLGLTRAYGPAPCRGFEPAWTALWTDGADCGKGVWYHWLTAARRLADVRYPASN